MIRTTAELNDALARGATEIELDMAERISLSNIQRPVTVHGRVAPAVIPAYFTPLVTVSSCEGITIALQIVGQPGTTGGFNGRGLTISKSRDVLVKGADIAQVNQGLIGINSEGVAIEGCDFHDVQVDAIIFQQMRRLSIVENWFRDFHPLAGNHADTIQGHSNNGATDDCDGVTIARNLIDLTPAQGVQGIFLSDAKFGGHRNVAIEDNRLLDTIWNAIWAKGCASPALRRNLVRASAASPYLPRVITPAGAVMEANQATDYIAADSLPIGNVRLPRCAPAGLAAERDAWLAEFRAPPGPTRDELMAELRAGLKAAQAAFEKLQDMR